MSGRGEGPSDGTTVTLLRSNHQLPKVAFCHDLHLYITVYVFNQRILTSFLMESRLTGLFAFKLTTYLLVNLNQNRLNRWSTIK